MRNDISSTDTLYLGIASKPQNLGVALTTQTTGSFRNFMIELQICNSPTSQRNFALSGISTSYRQLPPMGDCGIINGLGLNHLRKHK